MQRGDVYRLKVPKGIGHEQQRERCGVVVQSDVMLSRSVVIVAPTSRSARPASFRPEVDVAGSTTRVLVEQLGAVNAQRVGRRVGSLTAKRCGRSTKPSWLFSDSIDARGSAAPRYQRSVGSLVARRISIVRPVAPSMIASDRSRVGSRR